MKNEPVRISMSIRTNEESAIIGRDGVKVKISREITKDEEWGDYDESLVLELARRADNPFSTRIDFIRASKEQILDLAEKIKTIAESFDS